MVMDDSLHEPLEDPSLVARRLHATLLRDGAVLYQKAVGSPCQLPDAGVRDGSLDGTPSGHLLDSRPGVDPTKLAAAGPAAERGPRYALRYKPQGNLFHYDICERDVGCSHKARTQVSVPTIMVLGSSCEAVVTVGTFGLELLEVGRREHMPGASRGSLSARFHVAYSQSTRVKLPESKVIWEEGHPVTMLGNRLLSASSTY